MLYTSQKYLKIVKNVIIYVKTIDATSYNDTSNTSYTTYYDNNYNNVYNIHSAHRNATFNNKFNDLLNDNLYENISVRNDDNDTATSNNIEILKIS